MASRFLDDCCSEILSALLIPQRQAELGHSVFEESTAGVPQRWEQGPPMTCWTVRGVVRWFRLRPLGRLNSTISVSLRGHVSTPSHACMWNATRVQVLRHPQSALTAAALEVCVPEGSEKKLRNNKISFPFLPFSLKKKREILVLDLHRPKQSWTTG